MVFQKAEIHLKYGIKEANFTYAVWNKIKDRFPQYYNEIFIPTLKEICITYIKNLKFKELATLQEKYCEYCKNFDLLNNNDSKYTQKYKKYKKIIQYIFNYFNYFIYNMLNLNYIVIHLKIKTKKALYNTKPFLNGRNDRI